MNSLKTWKETLYRYFFTKIKPYWANKQLEKVYAQAIQTSKARQNHQGNIDTT